MFLKKLDQPLLEAIEENGFETPTKVQKACISKIKSGVDLFVKAPEKSGKTSTIIISVIQQLKTEFEDVPRAVIVVPDREAAIELKEKFEAFTEEIDLRIFGEGDAGNLHKLRDIIYAGSDVVIATAKKFNELYSYSGINLNNLKMFIVDDAEMIMKDQLLCEVNRFSEYLPKSQKIVFTTRINKRMQDYMENFMNFPQIVEIEEEIEEEIKEEKE
ncbi:DEAD/DEAH box helicase [Labilibaculum sp. DW002]|jgi:ATP-dependent RNA helicase RhlE|uniref:DEAD/DEAH box helicase n=1 Tax=Paralabilibaculum antarcticum TaxID=2912572 RepID=A0ABT5VTE6_9BACT|nr:DEAD/DEAH box helicase [Labilibaculum sp. DW002]MDE5418698.1 DEAD/DEAH box helicase [Labilibaculum sp. DW002]